MAKRSIPGWLIPPISILLFFGCVEIFLYAIDFKPSLNVHGSQVPFWARNAPSALRAIERMARTNKDLSNDVYAFEEDLHLFYKLRPNIEITVPFYDLSGMHLEASFPSWSIITDQDGHRVAGSRANSVSPRSGASFKKIAFMGGSSIFGWGTDYENTCAHQLEILIKDEYPEGRFRFVNYAVPGYAMSQHLRLLRKIIARKDFPKLIVLDATSNCDVPSSATDKERERIRLRPQNRLRFYLGSFRFFQLLEMMIQDLDSSDTDGGGNLLREPIPDYVNYLEEFIELVKEKNGKMIMIGICAVEGYVKQMISVAQTSRVPYISFGDVVKQYAGDSSKSPFGEHEGEIYRIVYTGKIFLKETRRCISCFLISAIPLPWATGPWRVHC